MTLIWFVYYYIQCYPSWATTCTDVIRGFKDDHASETLPNLFILL